MALPGMVTLVPETQFQTLHAYFEVIAVMAAVSTFSSSIRSLSLLVVEELRGRRYGIGIAFKSSANEEMKKKP